MPTLKGGLIIEWLRYAHGSTLINEYFVVPNGYYFYFDSVKSESTSIHRSVSQDYIDEKGNVHSLDPFESGILKPETRNTAIDKSVFMHQYAPGDVMTNHTLNFYPGESTKHLPKSELSKAGYTKLICGVIRPDMVIRPDEFLYSTSGLHEEFITFAELGGGKIPYSANTTLFDIIYKGITLDNGQVYKLPQGHIVLKSCRNLVFGNRNKQTGEVSLVGGFENAFNSFGLEIQSLTRMPSTGNTNNRPAARTPNSTKKSHKLFKPSEIFRGEHVPGTMTIGKAMPISSSLSSQASGKSRVYVTNYVRQDFPSKIERYNTKILKSFNERKYTVKQEFITNFPYDQTTNTFIPINHNNLLTPYDVYNIIMANTCHVCMRNLAKLTGNAVCPLCKIVGFCADHKGAPSYEKIHDCVISFYTEDEVKDIQKYLAVKGELEKKIITLLKDIEAIDRQIKETTNTTELTTHRSRFMGQVQIYKQNLLDIVNVIEKVNKTHKKIVQDQAAKTQAELKEHEAKQKAERAVKDNAANKAMKAGLAKMFK